MKTYMLCVLAGFILGTPFLVGQNNGTAPAAIPEEARRHFVMGETMFKGAKNVDAFTQAVAEFTEAARLAPQWPDARYNLALAKEAAGNYSGAMADLKLYQQFKLTDAEARTVQDKIYAIEAKQKLQVSDTAANAQEQWTKKIMAAQENFPELIAKLRGAVFAKNNGDEMYFVKTPFVNPPYDAYQTPYLNCQYSRIESGKRGYGIPEPVIPISNSEVQGSIACGGLTISSDGRTLTMELGDGTKSYLQKKE